MKAILFDHNERVRLEDVPTPVPDEGEVLVKIGACGICASDLHLAQIKTPDEVTWPVIPGHEVAGIVAQAGPGVEGWHAGDHVVVHPAQACGSCPMCLRGHTNLCQNPCVIGLHQPGGFAEYICAPAESLYSSQTLSDATAALTEPLACALHGFRRLNPRQDDSILLFGAGSIGLLFLQLIRNLGCHPIVVVDINSHRLQVAQDMGATCVVPANEEMPSMLRDIAPAGFDCVIDATGVASVVESLFDHVGWAGKALFLGSCPISASIELRPRPVQRREITVLGSFSFGNEFEPALQLLCEGVVDAVPILTHTYPLESFAEALAVARAGDTAIKVAFAPA